MSFNPFCLSSYLTFRYVVSEAEHWKPGVKPVFPASIRPPKVPVRTTPEIDAYLRGSFTADDRTGILLSGGTSQVAGLPEYLAEKFEVPTEQFDSFRSIHYDPKHFDPEYVKLISPQMAVAVGLATRAPED